MAKGIDRKQAEAVEAALSGRRTVDQVRAIIAARDPHDDRCDATCKCWIVAWTHSRGLHIETCDDCNSGREEAESLTDDDVAQLPAAKAALKRAKRIAESD